MKRTSTCGLHRVNRKNASESMDLAELRKQNEAEEEARQASLQTEQEPVESEQEELEEVVAESVEEDDNSEPEEESLEDQEEGKSEEAEAWLSSDEDPEKKFTDSDIGVAKQKLRAKLERKHESETEALKARIAELEAGNTVAPAKSEPPKYDDFDSEEEYFAAMMKHQREVILSEVSAQNTQVAQDHKALEAKRKADKAVEDHYSRAQDLISEKGISQDLYQNADLMVRKAIDAVRPGAGEDIVDALLARTGEGSEKVMYYLGRNPGKLNELQSSLIEDPTGIKLGMMFGALKAEFTMPNKRRTQAPKPATQLKGGAKTTAAFNEAAAKRKYDSFHKENKTGKAFEIKMEAKRNGVNVRDW